MGFESAEAIEKCAKENVKYLMTLPSEQPVQLDFSGQANTLALIYGNPSQFMYRRILSETYRRYESALKKAEARKQKEYVNEPR